MKTLTLSAFAIALMAAAPAYAQSSFVMIIGEAPSASASSEDAAPTSSESRIDRVVEESCVRPAVREIRSMMAYRECAFEVRKALEEESAGSEAEARQIAAR